MVALLLACAFTTNVPVMEMKTIAKGTMSGVDTARESVVRTPPEWEALWKQHAPGTPLPEIDFGTSMVIALFLGTRPTAGFEVTITEVDRLKDSIVVRYREARPSRDVMTAQVLTSPFHIVAVPRAPGRARFERVDANAAR
jgi:hypothetical protein